MSLNGNNFTSDNASTYKIFKSHLLLLANADIIVPLYQNKEKSWDDAKKNLQVKEETRNNDIYEQDNGLNSPNLNIPDDNSDDDDDEEEYEDPYSNFFNCLVENDFLLDMDEINKIINNNELKYIFYSNKLNFLSLVKFFCFKIVRLATIFSSSKYLSTSDFDNNYQTLMKSIRFLTKIMPTFFELCYSEKETEINEDIIFWNANTSETFQDFNQLTQNATVGALDSIISLDKDGTKTTGTLSSLNVEINFKAKNHSADFSTQPNWFLDGVAKKNKMPLGISLLISLMKILFMENISLPLSNEQNKGNISFQLWNNGILSQDHPQETQNYKPNPVFDSNRLEVMNLIEVLFSNSLYSSKKIDNKFLASWCCSMPEYLSVYLINSLINNFVDENNVLANASLNAKDILFYKYPQEYKLFKLKKDYIQKKERTVSTNSILVEYETNLKSAGSDSLNSQSSRVNTVEELLTIEESCRIRERYLRTSRNLLTLYFSFDIASICENTKLQISNSSNDLSDLTNVCQRSFKNLNTLADFKVILISIVKVLKLPMDKAIDEENKIFNLTSKNGSGFFDFFTKSSSTNDSSLKDLKSDDSNSAEDSVQSSDDRNTAEEESLPKNLNSLLTIFYEMLNCNEFFETHVFEIYSNKLLIILLYYLKIHYLNKNFISKSLPILTRLMIKITSSSMFSLRSLKYMNYDYYTEKLPKNLKIIDYDLNISSETHRDFFIYHISNMIINDIDKNLHPKIFLYEILNNLLLGTPAYLLNININNINTLLAKEQKMLNNKVGNFFSGPTYGTCRKLIQIFYAMVKNQEYLNSFSIDKQGNYQFLLEKTSNSGNISSSGSRFSIDHSSSASGYGYTGSGYSVYTKTACDSTETNVTNILMNNGNIEAKIDVNDVSKIPYCFTPASKWESLSLLLRTISFVVTNCFADYKNLIFLLCKYGNIFFELNSVIGRIDADIAGELAPLLLKFLPEGVNKNSNFSNSSLNVPFDIALHSYPTFVDEILAVDDDSLNDFDPMRFNTMKIVSTDAINNDHSEDEFYVKSNSNISFIDSDNASILDLNTGRRIINSSSSILANELDQNGNGLRPQLSIKVNTNQVPNKKKCICEKSSDIFLPNLYNNTVYNSINCQKPLGLSNKKIKKLIVKNADNFRQSVSTESLQNRSFWFVGKKYFMFLSHVISIISKHFNNKLSSFKQDQIKNAIYKIVDLEEEIIGKRLVDFIPVELTTGNFLTQYSRLDKNYNPTKYQFYQTLIWRTIFNDNTIEYKLFSEEISGNADLLNNLNGFHNSYLTTDDLDSHYAPSSPMLEKWVSNKSLSKVESCQSNSSFNNNNNSNVKSIYEQNDVIDSSISNTYGQYSTFNINSSKIQEPNTFLITSGLAQPLLWYSTNVKMFPIKKLERDEFSIMDMTSNFLNKFKFNKSSGIVKTPEELAAEEIKRAYTPRSSISSVPSRK
ncbi:hypothetical protein ACO0SA_002049 [Hanseniaspora valbyensis]